LHAAALLAPIYFLPGSEMAGHALHRNAAVRPSSACHTPIYPAVVSVVGARLSCDGSSTAELIGVVSTIGKAPPPTRRMAGSPCGMHASPSSGVVQSHWLARPSSPSAMARK